MMSRQSLNSCKNLSLNLPYSSLALNLEFKGSVNTSNDYWYWCISPIQSSDGKTHLFCARWANEFESWKTDSEIVHLVSDSPEGPFEFSNIVLSKSLSPVPWQSTFHNPHIKYIDDKYVLLYITMDTRLPSIEEQLAHQMIGLAYSDSPYGPWTFCNDDGIVIKKSDDPSHWTTTSCCGCSNPAINKIADTYVIYFKSGKKILPTRIEDFYGCAYASSLLGPYELCAQPITDNTNYIEDATTFSVGHEHYLLTTDNFGTHIGGIQGGILWKLEDNFFSLKNAQVGFGLLTDYTDLTPSTTFALNNHSHKFERPGILLIDHVPAYFYAANRTSLTGTGKTETYVLKIAWQD